MSDDVNVEVLEDAVQIAVPESVAGHAAAVGDAAHAGLAIVSATALSDPADDQLWYDQANEQLKRWDGAEWRTEGKGTYQRAAPITGVNRFIRVDGPVSFGGSGSQPEGEINAIPFHVPSAVTVNRLDVSVSTAGSAGAIGRMGLYTDNGGMVPDALVTQGTVGAETTGVKSLVVSEALDPGWYWFAFVPQGAAATPPGWRRLFPHTGERVYPTIVNLAGQMSTTARVVGFGQGDLPATFPAFNDGFVMTNFAVRVSA